MITRPINNCYWVIPGKLLAGEYPGDVEQETSKEKIKSLLDTGVAAFIDLTEENELLPYSEFRESASHERYPIQDQSIPSSLDFTKDILDAIDFHISQRRLVYIHCWGGVGRTGIIVGCWPSIWVMMPIPRPQFTDKSLVPIMGFREYLSPGKHASRT